MFPRPRLLLCAAALASLALAGCGTAPDTDLFGMSLIRENQMARKEAEGKQVERAAEVREERRRERQEAVARGEPAEDLPVQTEVERRQRSGWNLFGGLRQKPEFYLFGHAARVAEAFFDRPSPPPELTTVVLRAKEFKEAVWLRGESELVEIKLVSRDPGIARAVFQNDRFFIEGVRPGQVVFEYADGSGRAFATFLVDVRN